MFDVTEFNKVYGAQFDEISDLCEKIQWRCETDEDVFCNALNGIKSLSMVMFALRLVDEPTSHVMLNKLHKYKIEADYYAKPHKSLILEYDDVFLRDLGFINKFKELTVNACSLRQSAERDGV